MKILLSVNFFFFISAMINVSLADYSEWNNYYDRACTNLVKDNVQNNALTGYFRGAFDIIGETDKTITNKEMKEHCNKARVQRVSFQQYAINVVRPLLKKGNLNQNAKYNLGVSYYSTKHNYYDKACSDTIKNKSSDALVGYFRGVFDILGNQKDITLTEIKQRCVKAVKEKKSFRRYAMSTVIPLINNTYKPHKLLPN
jgi:hypothetical protein